MLKFLKNKKIFLALMVIFVLAGGFFVLGAAQAKAAGFLEWFTAPGEFVLVLVANLLQIIMLLFSKLLALAAALLDGVFQIGKFRNIAIVNTGWQITRGLANMFFALILLIMAVATVLQVETFGIKKILPRLVIAALLINFSLLFAGIIIDFSQVFTGYFIDAAKGSGTISTQLVNGLSIANVYNTEAIRSATSSAAFTASANAVPANTGPRLGTGMEANFNIVIGMVFGIIVMVVATFAVLAAAILLIFRVVALWLLLIFAPLAWVSMVVPGSMAGSLWDKWWSYFLKWTFFAPIYAFFIYLAILAVGSGSFTQAFKDVKTTPEAGIFNSLAGSTTLLLQYVVIIIILVGGLYVAQTFGIKGAGTIMSWGKKAGKATAKWTGRKATGYDVVAPKVVSGAGSVVGALGFTKTGGILKGKATEMKQKQLERKGDKLYHQYLTSLNDKDLMEQIEKGGRREKVQALKIAKERGLFDKEDEATRLKAKDALKAFKAFGLTKETKEMEETMPDIIDDDAIRNEAIDRAVANGTDKKWRGSVFSPENKNSAEIINKWTTLKSPVELVNAIKGYPPAVKDKATKAIYRAIEKSPENTNLRKAYASTTGDIAKAFTVAVGAPDTQKKKVDDSMIEYIKELKPAQFGDIKDSDEKSWELVVAKINKNMLASIGGQLSQRQKEAFTDQVEKLKRADLKEYIENSLAWGGRTEQPRRQAGF